MADFAKLFEDLGKVKIGIVGDVMLDTYWWGSVERISPEAPVPVVALKKKDFRIGGAGNVALNTVSLGASTSLFSVTWRQLSLFSGQTRVSTPLNLQFLAKVHIQKVKKPSREWHLSYIHSGRIKLRMEFGLLAYANEGFASETSPHRHSGP